MKELGALGLKKLTINKLNLLNWEMAETFSWCYNDSFEKEATSEEI